MTETSTDFTICFDQIEAIKNHRGEMYASIKQGYVLPLHEKDVVKTFSTDVLIAEILRRDNKATIISNNINQ